MSLPPLLIKLIIPQGISKCYKNRMKAGDSHGLWTQNTVACFIAFIYTDCIEELQVLEEELSTGG